MSGIWLSSYIILWLIVIALAVMTFSLLRLVGSLHQRVGPAGALVTDNGPDIGQSLPDILESEGIADHTVLSFPKSRDTLVIFVSPNCPACEELLRSLIPFRMRQGEGLEIVLISTSAEVELHSELSRKAAQARLPYLSLPKLATAVHIGGTPFGLWLDREGVVHAKGIVNHAEHLESLKNARESGFPSLQEYLDSVASQQA
jgi:methylamine dehydrogenase accessory protein MauD